MNNVKKYVIIISMIFFVVIGIVLIRNSFLVGFVNEFRGKNMSPSFTTIDECIDYQMDYYRDLLDSDNGATSYDLAELLYRLEYNNQLAIFFQSSDDTVWVYVIETSNSDDKISYRIIDSRTIFVLFDEWESIGNFKYKCFENQPDATKISEDSKVVSVYYEGDKYYIVISHT